MPVHLADMQHSGVLETGKAAPFPVAVCRINRRILHSDIYERTQSEYVADVRDTCPAEGGFVRGSLHPAYLGEHDRRGS